MRSLAFLCNYLQRGSPIENKQWEMLEREVIEKYPQFRKQVFSVIRLSLMQYRVCLLIKAGFKPTEIAQAVGRSKSAIANMRYRLYCQAFPGGHAKFRNWDEFILKL